MVGTAQKRGFHCLKQNLVLENPLEQAEGRVPVIFDADNQASMFAADFTYVKTTNQQGEQILVLDDEGLATPTWLTTNTAAGNWLTDDEMTNIISQPNGGNGFFKSSQQDPGITQVATETLRVSGPFQLTSERNDGATEVLNAVALNSYCGDQTNP